MSDKESERNEIIDETHELEDTVQDEEEDEDDDEFENEFAEEKT
ncbi:MAG TPA: hypothetical protein VIY08_11710 [Candidatus Nitrosocosmicus sp.]